MTADLQASRKKRRPLLLALSVLLGLLIALIVPPLISLNSYKGRITQLMAQSLGRPVQLSSVELHLLPVPSFVLTDLTVQEDPAYGAEPVLKANTVTASIRLLSLWRGRLEIGKVSVDEASLNVVRTPEGRWNLDPFFRSAARVQPGIAQPAGAATPAKAQAFVFPYLEATSLRINFKRGAEKLPFSLIDADFSFWQDQPGDWRIRLRGQPARTDLSLDMADTGLVRLEARARRAPELRQIPVHLDMEWREAQLGQLSRLLVGSDPGWRGDLTGELHLDGTPESAKVQTRLRASGVHRAEFAPAAPMDFDATCAFLYHLSARAVDNLACDSPLGDGRLHIAGNLPGNGAPPHISVEMTRIAVAAGLDALRTVRSGFGQGLQAAGEVSGKITYAHPEPDAAVVPVPAKRSGARAAKPHAPPPGPLTGTLTVTGFELSGAGLSTPIQAARLVLQPVAAVAAAPPAARSKGHAAPQAPATPAPPAALETTLSLAAGAPVPLNVTARFALSGYRITVRGQAAMARAREFAALAGMAHADALASLTGDAVTVDLAAAGPWQPPLTVPFAPEPNRVDAADVVLGASLVARPDLPPPSDTLTGTVALKNASWQADYLANPIEVAQATLSLDEGSLRWDPVVFSYGPVKGTASLQVPARCAPDRDETIPSTQPAASCQPEFDVHFASLDAAVLQTAFLGARQPGTLLSSLLARLKPASAKAPTLPAMSGKVSADALVLGPVTLSAASAQLHLNASGAEFSAFDADLLGGHVHGAGAFTIPDPANPKSVPQYTLDGDFKSLSPAAVGLLLGQRWSGDPFSAAGKVLLSGYSAESLAASATGTLHMDWRKGSLDLGPAHGTVQKPGGTGTDLAPATLRFDRWTADAAIAHGAITLGANQRQTGATRQAVTGSLTFGDPPKLSVSIPKPAHTKP